MAQLARRYERVEYRGDWEAQTPRADIIGHVRWTCRWHSVERMMVFSFARNDLKKHFYVADLRCPVDGTETAKNRVAISDLNASVCPDTPYPDKTNTFKIPYTLKAHGVPTTLPPSSNLTPSPLSSPLFSSSVIPSPSLGQLPLNPPSVPPVATTRWHGTPGAKGFRRRALPTARGDVPRCRERSA